MLAAGILRVPAYGWLRGYRSQDLRADLWAGSVVAVMLIPQGMAYALLAGMPPIYGLYASTVPAVVYAFFGTTKHVPVGPFAITTLLTFASVSGMAQPGSTRYVSLVLLLALMVGVLQFGLGLLRLGFVANFIPRPVVNGFIYASAVVIVLGQVDKLLGIAVPHRGSTLSTLLGIVQTVDQTNLATLAISGCSILLLVGLARFVPRLAAPLVMVGSTIVAYSLDLDRLGVEIVGTVPRGLPDFSVPPMDVGAIRSLFSAALTIAFVGFVSSISAAKAVATRERHKIDSDQELRALGLANVCAAFSSGFPIAGSLTRTAVQFQAGARTQLASITTALVIVLTLLFLTPLFYYLPSAALAATIVVAVYKLLDFKDARRTFRVSKTDGGALLVTFVTTLLVGVEQGIVIGSVFALLAFVRRSAYPNVVEMGYVEEKQSFLGVDRFPAARIYEHILIVRFDAALYYANVPVLEEWLIKAVANRPQLEWIVVDCRGVNSIDSTAIVGLEDLITDYRSREIGILFSHVKLGIRERLEKAGWGTKFGGNPQYSTTRDAARAIGLPK